jgi:hypothetical protein
MTDAAQTADTTDARQASTSRVQTRESVLASLATPTAASEQPTSVEQTELTEGEKSKGKSPSERWQKLANERRDALEKVSQASAENAELRKRLEALESKAAPAPSTDPEPERSAFATEGEYLKATARWMAKQEIADERKREEQARVQAQQAELERQFSERRDKAIAEIEDYADTITNSTVSIPDALVPALLESEHGPFIAYYLAKNPEEARKLAHMSTPAGIRYLVALERELDTDDTVETPKQRPRAPEPITPVKGTAASAPGTVKTFQEYKAKRLAQEAKKR